MKARPTMTPDEEAAWAGRATQPGAGVQSAAAEVQTQARMEVAGSPNVYSSHSVAAPRARVPIRRVRLRDEREVIA